jgi:insertion element IS1 protein InsB
MAMRVGPQCPSARLVNKGSAAGKPKQWGQQCGDQVTRITPRGKPLTTKITAVRCCRSGMSMHRLAFLLRVSAQAVLNGRRAWAKRHDEQPAPTGTGIIWEPAERGHELKNQRRQLGIGKAWERDPGHLVEGECGRRDKAPLQKLLARVVPWAGKVYGTDNWATDASVIPRAKLVQRQATPDEIARHHGRQRHWWGRFKRQSIGVSPAQEMVDLTMALLATFWVNGHQDELLSLLG